jgi:hypothetical protein
MGKGEPTNPATTQEGASRSYASPQADRDRFPSQKRHCSGCALLMDVTWLQQGRRYQCASCGTTFRHFRWWRDDGQKKAKGAGWSRVAVASVASAALVEVILYSGDASLDSGVHAAVAFATAALAFAGITWARRMSRDSAGLVGVTLAAAAVGTFAALSFASDVSASGSKTATFAMIAWGALGTIQIARFMRNIATLPRVGECGMVREPS